MIKNYEPYYMSHNLWAIKHDLLDLKPIKAQYDPNNQNAKSMLSESTESLTKSNKQDWSIVDPGMIISQFDDPS